MLRLGNNHGGYHGETLDIQRVLREIEGSAMAHGWSSEVFHEAHNFRWLALQRPASVRDNGKQVVRAYLSAGIHGDEPAGPLAALRLVQEDSWPDHFEVTLLPCLNPPGFARNSRSNPDSLDLNRDYLHLESAEVRAHIAWLEKQPPYAVCLCLHEDWESHGFYLYELNPDNQPTLAETMVASVATVCPVDPSAEIEGRSASGGIIRPTLDPRSRPQWPEAFWLLTHKTRLSYTLEAPSDFPLPTRVNALTTGVKAALRTLAGSRVTT